MKFSIIVPVLHEVLRIHGLIEHLDHLDSDQPSEIIVVDGSPDNETIAAIRSDTVITLTSETGRARQMNAGASIARGEILLFLHADTQLPGGALRQISSVIDQGNCVGGAFELGIQSDKLIYKALARWASLRCRFTRIPYGDQAIFIRRDYFDKIGGYKDIPLMEDVELMRRIKKLGDDICVLSDRVMTSPRRWEEEGFFYVNVRNTMLALLYFLGVPPERLARFYKNTYSRYEDS